VPLRRGGKRDPSPTRQLHAPRMNTGRLRA
jgi:hypothetical protein